MKFKAGSRRKPIEYEKALIDYWREHKIFEKSVETRPAKDGYVFYDGPPFITGVPHHGTLLSSVVKDAIPRYQTMKGKRVERVWGWDCHGLPAEVYTEEKLGIKDKRDIGTKISLEDYIIACRENMVQTGNQWEETIARIGRWVDFQGAYKTMDKPYMESVWWAFKTLYDAGKIYEGEKVLLYCTRDATPIAKAEVAMDNSYRDVTDPSVYIKFKLQDQDAYLLAWTTTPWTLPANTGLAVNKATDYVEVEVDGTKLVLAKERAAAVLTDDKHQPLDYKVLREFKGSELIGKSYEPLFESHGDKAHQVWHAPYVHLDEGSGIVHLAPAYGEEDYQLAKEHGFPIISLVDDNGLYTGGRWKGQLVWDVNKEIAKKLLEEGTAWKLEYVTHSYPHCHRCGTRLMYRAHPSWFMDIDGQRDLMLEQNEPIYWFPEHFKEGRFKKNIEQAPDWNLSRDRFWATALPVWKGTDKAGKQHVKVVGSYAELKELSGVELEDYHRPWVDDITFEIDGVKYQRVDKVMDSWFEAGSMPYAQFHYPFENKDKFESEFPGDFIAEYVGQIRAWFYYLHALSVGLFGKNSFKNVIVTGTITGNDGRKLSKSLGNYTDPNEVMDKYSADALRFTMLNSPVMAGEDISLLDKDVSDNNRKLSMVWNMYDFFTTYASVDGWEWNGRLEDPSEQLENDLDKWIVARLHSLMLEVEESMDKYDIPGALKGVLPFIDDASNWYVRRSRKRFWKSDNDQDKDLAYKTLHYVLVRLSQVMAPFTPFMSEELYRQLTGGESVHLTDWPEVNKPDKASTELLLKMEQVRAAVEMGLAQRAAAGLKVRQPLANVKIYGLHKLDDQLIELIKDELNVKQVEVVKGPVKLKGDEKFTEVLEKNHDRWPLLDIKVELDLTLTAELKTEGLAREVIRQVQEARKQAGLQVDDRIALKLETDSDNLQKALKSHHTAIYEETLATKQLEGKAQHSQTVETDGQKLLIELSKAA